VLVTADEAATVTNCGRDTDWQKTLFKGVFYRTRQSRRIAFSAMSCTERRPLQASPKSEDPPKEQTRYEIPAPSIARLSGATLEECCFLLVAAP
jgi:hypothetical protein